MKALVSVPMEKGESLSDYVTRVGLMVLEDNKAICKAVDSTIGSGYVSQSTVDSAKRTANTINARYSARKETMTDYLARNPLAYEMWRAGMFSKGE